MAQESYSCFEEYQFFGEFFADINSNSGRFPAKVKYSPSSGLQLEYSLSDSDAPDKCERLFGILNNGKLCTLVGPFDFNSGTHYSGKVLVRSGLHGFYFLMIGEFVEEHEVIESCHFTFNGMQEFFHPQGFISQLKYQKEPILCTQGNGWEIQVENQATYSMLGDNIVNLINSREDEAQEKLEASFKTIKKEHPKAYFNLRKTLKFFFRFQSQPKDKAGKSIENITKISALFAVLMSRPTFPDEITLFLEEENRKHVHVLNSMCLESRTVQLAQKKIIHLHMPLNWKDLDMVTVLNSWFELYDDFRVLSASHQYETGFRTLHYAYSDIILYSTQIEAINIDLGGKSREKYVKPIQTYACPNLMAQLNNVFAKVNDHELGKNIADLRNELAHVGRPKVLMEKLTINDYVTIGHLLQLIVVSHLLAKLDISQEKRYQYQYCLIL